MPGWRVRGVRVVDRALVETVAGAPEGLRDLPGLVALRGSEVVGLLVYDLGSDGCRIVHFHTTVERIGLTGAMLREVKRVARRHRSPRVWVSVAQDDAPRRRGYERNGFRVRAAAGPTLVMEITLRSPDTAAL